MSVVEIEAQPYHCGQIVRMLRHEHALLLDRMGVAVHAELRMMFDASAMRRAWLVDGRLAAIAGVFGTMLSDDGILWLALSEEVTKRPILVARHALRFVEDALFTKGSINTFVLEGDRTALQFAYFLGFNAVREDKIGNQSIKILSCHRQNSEAA